MEGGRGVTGMGRWFNLTWRKRLLLVAAERTASYDRLESDGEHWEGGRGWEEGRGRWKREGKVRENVG